MGTATAETVAQPTEIKLSILDLATKGGWIMVLLAVLSIIAVYIFIERYIAVSRATKYDNGFMERIRDVQRQLHPHFKDD